MVTDYAQFVFLVRIEFPRFVIKTKSKSWFMKLLAFLLLVVTFGRQKTFLTGYVTTIGTTVYVPEGFNAWADTRKLAVLRHERVHMRQAKKYGLFLFAVAYLFLPVPLGLAYCRARFEWEAYEESMRASSEQHGLRLLDDVRYRDSILKEFTTGAYGWMWPFRGQLERWYAASKAKITAERA